MMENMEYAIQETFERWIRKHMCERDVMSVMMSA